MNTQTHTHTERGFCFIHICAAPSQSDIFTIIPLWVTVHQSVKYKPHRRRTYVYLLAIGERSGAGG